MAKSLELVGERWTLLIVRDLLLHGTRRFQDLQDSLAGIAPRMLSERLKLMERHGLVERTLYSEHPPRAAYALTERGKDLRFVVGAMAVWGSRHVHPDTAVVHADCDHPVEVAYFCPQCGGRVRGAAVTVRARRGALPPKPGPASPRAVRRSARRAGGRA